MSSEREQKLQEALEKLRGVANNMENPVLAGHRAALILIKDELEAALALPLTGAKEPLPAECAGDLEMGWINKLDSIFSTLSEDRKSTRLNSSHSSISYAVFCLKKKITYYLKKFT